MIVEFPQKVNEGQGATPFTPEISMLTYRGKEYPVREVCGKELTYMVSVQSLHEELLKDMDEQKAEAFDLDEELAYFCTDEEIHTLTDEELDKMIYD